MANTAILTNMSEGTNLIVAHWYFESDGNEGEFFNRVILDPSTDFNIPPPPKVGEDGKLLPRHLTVRQAWFATSWFDMTIGFESDIELRDTGMSVNKIVLPRDAHFHMDYRPFGGIYIPRDSALEQTGRLVITTKDFAPLGSNGFLVLEIRKD